MAFERTPFETHHSSTVTIGDSDFILIAPPCGFMVAL